MSWLDDIFVIFARLLGRYRTGGTRHRKSPFDLRRVAVVHDQHVIARQDTTTYELAA